MRLLTIELFWGILGVFWGLFFVYKNLFDYKNLIVKKSLRQHLISRVCIQKVNFKIGLKKSLSVRSVRYTHGIWKAVCIQKVGFLNYGLNLFVYKNLIYSCVLFFVVKTLSVCIQKLKF